MTYVGRFKNGVVVLDGHPAIEEGALVRVEPVATVASEPRRGSAEAITRAIESGARWQGSDEEMDRLLAELKEMKRAELKAQLEAERSNLPDEP